MGVLGPVGLKVAPTAASQAATSGPVGPWVASWLQCCVCPGRCWVFAQGVIRCWWTLCWGGPYLLDAGIDQGGFGAAEGASQQLTVLREAPGFDMITLQDARRDQGGWSVADGPSHQLAVLWRKF